MGLTADGIAAGMGASYVGAGATALKGVDMLGRALTDEGIQRQRGAFTAQKHTNRQSVSKPHGDNSVHHKERATSRQEQQGLDELMRQKEEEAIEKQLGLMKAASALDAEYERLSQKSADDIKRAKLGASDLENFLIDTAITGAQVASDAAANAVVPGSGIVLKGVRSFGDASQEARRAGATVGQQVAYGALTAGKDVVIEKTFDGLAGT